MSFLSKGAKTYWRARSSALERQNEDIMDWALFAKTMETGFGHQDPEQMQGISWMSLSRLDQWRIMLAGFSLWLLR